MVWIRNILIPLSVLFIFSAHGYCEDKQNKENIQSLQFKDDFPKYCKEIGGNEIFDGSTTYNCFYPDLTLTETYERIKSALDKGKFFKEEAFHKEKSKYRKDVHWINKVGAPMEESADVTYEWTKKNKLKIIVDQNSEVSNLIFEKTKSGTNFSLIVETAY